MSRPQRKRRFTRVLQFIRANAEVYTRYMVLVAILCLTAIFPSLQPLQIVFTRCLMFATLIVSKQVLVHLAHKSFHFARFRTLNEFLSDAFATFVNVLIYGLLALMMMESATRLLLT